MGISGLIRGFLILLSGPRIEGLVCSVCAKTGVSGAPNELGSHQVDIDGMRITTNLRRPYCLDLEEMECGRDQDACLMSIQNMRHKGFWVNMGCTFKSKFSLTEDCSQVPFSLLISTSGHPGLRLREDVERSHSVTIQMLNNTDDIVIEPRKGGSLDRAEAAMGELREGWLEDDFSKAKELIELMESEPDKDFFNVQPKYVSSLIGHYGRRVAGLENRSNASIKIDCTGHIATFGSKEACARAKKHVFEWIQREGGGEPDPADFKDNFTDGDKTFNGDPASIKGPCVLTFWVPSRGAALIIGRHGSNVGDFERQYRCLVDLRTKEETHEGLVPVDITAKLARVAFDAKDGMLKFLDRFFTTRDWTQKYQINGATSFSSRNITTNSSTGTSPTVSKLTFTVAEEHAPRLIGTKGNNKKRLEERGNCCLVLRTEEKRNNCFPVDIIALSAEDCERARNRIITFLNERPTTMTPPKRQRVGTEESQGGDGSTHPNTMDDEGADETPLDQTPTRGPDPKIERKENEWSVDERIFFRPTENSTSTPVRSVELPITRAPTAPNLTYTHFQQRQPSPTCTPSTTSFIGHIMNSGANYMSPTQVQPRGYAQNRMGCSPTLHRSAISLPTTFHGRIHENEADDGRMDTSYLDKLALMVVDEASPMRGLETPPSTGSSAGPGKSGGSDWSHKSCTPPC